MKKIIFSAIVLSFLSVEAFSQAQFAVGLKAGINVAKLNTDDVATSSITAFHGGAFALIKVTKIGIQPEFLFSQQGSTLDDVSFNNEDLKLSYISIPVMLKWYIAAGFNIQAGPQFGFLNSAELKGASNVEDGLKSSDITANVGLAWDAPFGIVLDARYNIGLTDINDGTTIQGPIKGNTFQFSVGYKLFKFGK